MHKEIETQMLAGMAESVPGGLIKFETAENGRLRILYANQGFYGLLGYTKESWEMEYGDCLEEAVFSEDRALLKKEMENGSRDSIIELELRMSARGAHYIWIALRAKCKHSEERVKLYYAAVMDINRQKQAEEELFVQNGRYRVLQELTEDIIIDYDIQTDTLYIPHRFWIQTKENGAVEKFMETLKQEDVIYPEDVLIIFETYEYLMQKKTSSEIEFRTNFMTGSYRWFGGIFQLVENEQEQPVRIIGRIADIDVEKNKILELQYMARLDPMTGLLNKNAMQEDIEQALNGSHEMMQHAFLLIDIDNFKRVNEGMGHAFGDAIIRSLAENIQECGEKEGILGRLGGDEFGLFVLEKSRQQIAELAKNILSIIRSTYTGENKNIMISGSIGIAVFPEDGKTYEELFKSADRALYLAKANGKEQYIFYHEKSGELQRKSSICSYGLSEITESYLRGRVAANYNRELISYSFQILATSKSLISAMNLTLERIGRTFELSQIQVQRVNREKRSMEVLYLWHDKIVELDKKNRLFIRIVSWKEMQAQFDHRGIFKISDVSEGELTEDFKRAVKENKSKAFVKCAIWDEKGEMIGMVTFHDCQKVRKWNRIEIDTFLEYTKLITYFLLSHADRKRDIDRIDQLRNYDRITGLYQYNQYKREIRKILNKQIYKGQLVMMNSDIGNFKYINDVYGTEVGDSILHDYAEYAILRNPSCIAGCRVYADNFYALFRLNGMSGEEFVEFVMKGNQNFVEQQNKKHPGLYFSIYSGIYYLEEMDQEVVDVLDCAALARKMVKENPEFTVMVYHKNMQMKLLQESRILSLIRQAVFNGELVPYLQPKFDLVTNEIVGAEALVRWKKDGKIYFYPSDFIPALEKSGDIVAVDFCVYTQILKKMREWMKKGETLYPISVNISRVHCRFSDCEMTIIDLADKYQIPHEYIELEITESTFLENSDMLQEKLDILKQEGFRISMDDFGAGYSSLSMLSNMPFDVIKLDQSFLNCGTNSKRAGYVMEAIFQMAKKMEVEVICEGVETQEQSDFLVERGCRLGQGYLFAKPMPIDEFEKKYLKS